MQSSTGLHYHICVFFLICQSQWLTSYIDSHMLDLVNRKSTGRSDALIQNSVSKICMSFLSYNNNKQNQLITSFWSWITCMIIFFTRFQIHKKNCNIFPTLFLHYASFTCMYIVTCGNKKMSHHPSPYHLITWFMVCELFPIITNQ